jgi:hypothetical protein
MRADRWIIVVAMAVALTAPTAANATPRVSTGLPGFGGPGAGACPLGLTLICAADGLANGAGDVINGAVKVGVGSATDSLMSGISSWAADGASWLLSTIGRQVDHSTRPRLGSPWFANRYDAVRNVSIGLALAFLLVAITQAALRRDLKLLIRCSLVMLPTALLLMFAAVTLVELGLALTDELSAAVLGGANGEMREAFGDLGRVLSVGGGAQPALPGFLIFIAALMTSLLSLLVWLELALREAAVYLAVMFLPLALAGAVWPRTGHWAWRLASWLVALVLAKLTIAVAFSLAGSMVAGARPGSGGLSALLAGAAVLVLAASSPWILLRLIPFSASPEGSIHRTELTSSARQLPGAGAALLLARQSAQSPGPSAGKAGAVPATWAPSAARGEAAIADSP